MTKKLVDEARKMRRAQGAMSLKEFMQLYLSHHILITPSEAHDEIYDLLDLSVQRRGSKIAIAAPRSFGKTTLITLAHILRCVCYQKEPYIMVLSNTKSQACQILESVKRELETNLKLREGFPELLSVKPKPWNQEQIQTLNGVRVAAFGSEQNIRGRKHGQYRPSLVVADDLEKSDLGFNSETKEKLKNWFEQTVLEIGNSATNYMLIGNFYHPECLLGDYIDEQKRPDWTPKVYRALVSWPTNTALWDSWRSIYNSREVFQDARGSAAALKFYEVNKAKMDAGGVVLWPDRWSLYELMAMHENNPIKFNAEYQNEPLDARTCYFVPDSYQYWDDFHKTIDDLLKSFPKKLDFFGGCDPSMGADKTKGDYTGIAIVGRDQRDGRLYHVLSDISRIDPHEAIDLILGYFKRFHFSRFAIESNQFQALMPREFQRRSQELRIYAPIEEVKNMASKIARIQSLQPLMKSGTLVLNRMNMLLNKEVQYFPKARYDDGLDSLELAIRMAEDRRVKVSIIGGGRRGGWDDDWTSFNQTVRGVVI